MEKLAEIDISLLDPYCGDSYAIEVVPGTSFCLATASQNCLVIVDYEQMEARRITCPKEFELGVVDNRGYFFGMVGFSCRTVTVLDPNGEIAARLRVKGNTGIWDFFLLDGQTHVVTSTLGIFEFSDTRTEETITRIYTVAPCEFLLNAIEHLAGDNGRVVVLYIVLRKLRDYP